ncbi:DoxX family protein [Seonamhaeicola marinus]|uniref:DoxX family membrane protein n=1 Tax=Seonamhaeicola marinus TaxID=1912246 RepID=A0A5D0HV10_9FLAO|nr:hypothetical protein [Seonamhaeicola marinus]TYA74751.1 hypothetical protein FUA24_15695 [Seonamhaeicola marinus]
MKPLTVLVVVTLIAIGYYKIAQGNFNVAASARIGMAVMLVFTSIGHFIYDDGMAMMLPDFIPLKKQIVHLTGIMELVAAVGLLIPQYRVRTGWLLVVFFILIIPANIYGAMQQVDFQKATLNGKGLSYLFFRIPLQILFITWVYFSAVKDVPSVAN